MRVVRSGRNAARVQWGDCSMVYRSWSKLASHMATHYRIAQLICFECSHQGVPALLIRDQARDRSTHMRMRRAKEACSLDLRMYVC